MLREAVDCGLLLNAAGVQHLGALAMPTCPPEWHREVHRQPGDHVLCSLQRLEAFVHAQLHMPQNESECQQQFRKLRSMIPQSALHDLVRLVAQRDVCGGDPSPDATCTPKKSLRHVWWLCEYAPLQTRRYSPDTDIIERGCKWT